MIDEAARSCRSQWHVADMVCCKLLHKVSMLAPDTVCCRKNMLEFMHKAAKVTDDIMTCFAIGLGLPEAFYKEASRLVLSSPVH